MARGITQEEMTERFKAQLKSLTELVEAGSLEALGFDWETDVKERLNDDGIVEKRPGDNQTWTFKVRAKS